MHTKPAASLPTGPAAVPAPAALVAGEGEHCVLMVHGWPDGPALWQASSDALQDRYRCVRVCLPGFDLSRPAQAPTLDQLVDHLLACADAHSPGRPVTLLLHDWGCFFGYELAARHPHRVARVVGVDIGDTNSRDYLGGLGAKAKALIASYQLALALAWRLGPRWPGLANAITRRVARWVGSRRAPAELGWQMNYPYAMQWFASQGGLRGVARVHRVLGHQMPALFIYGHRKAFMFHSEAWLAQLRALPGCDAVGLEAGHWLMLQQPERFNACVRDWLLRGDAAPAQAAPLAEAP